MNRLAVGQMNCRTGDLDHNLGKMDLLAADASKEGAALLVLPELAVSGYRVDEDFARLAQPLDGDVVKELTAIAKNRGVWIYTSIPERREDGLPYNTAVLVSEAGLMSSYRKIHLWRNEEKYFSAGDRFEQADTPLGLAGLLVCFDISFPEAARANTLNGAQLLLYTMAFSPAARKYALHLFAQARALENICYVAVSNRVGTEKDTVFSGGSLIVAPDGKVAGVCDGEEGVVSAQVDGAVLEAMRGQYPYFEARRPSLYRRD